MDRKRWAPKARTLPSVIVQPSATSKGDKVLLRITQCAQIIGIAVAILGYIFTVRPVYQKQLVDEQIAKATIELTALKTEIAVKEAEVGAKVAEIAGKEKQLRDLGFDLKKAQTRLVESGKRQGELYSELRVHLGTQFQLSAFAACGKISDIDQFKPDALPACVKKEFRDNGYVGQMSEADKRLLGRLIDEALPKLSDELGVDMKSYQDRAKELRESISSLKETARRLKEAAKPSDSYEAKKRESDAFFATLKEEIALNGHRSTADAKFEQQIYATLERIWNAFANQVPLASVSRP
jgi:hypothetical protein